MGIFDGCLLVTDIDGTLTNQKNTVSEKDKSSIEYFKNEGGLFTIATGRLKNYIVEHNYNSLANAPIILYNGGMIFDFQNNELLYKSPLKTKYKEIVKYIKTLKNYHHSDFCTPEGYCELSDCDNPKEPIKIVTVFNDEQSAKAFRDKLRQKYGEDFDIYRSWNCGVEVLNKNCGKGEAIEVIKSKIKNIKFCAAVGDYENDISMIYHSDLFFAPKNSVEELKAKSDFIVNDHNFDAISDVIKKLKELKNGTV